MIAATESAAIQSTQTHGISDGLSDKEQSTAMELDPLPRTTVCKRAATAVRLRRLLNLDHSEWAIVKAHLDLV